MIKRINIKKFGVFNSFKGNVIPEFENLNIIYGRNYSGKTTLSRIFRLLQKRNVEEVGDNKFEFTSISGIINETNVNNHSLDVVVYNSDFVKDNLSWIHNPQGNINPFTILGEENKKEQEKLEIIKEKIGTEDGTGLLNDIKNAEKEELEIKKEFERIKKNNDLLCTNLASEIKGNQKYYIYDVDGKSFDITHVKKLIDLKDTIVKLNEKEINILEEEATSKALPALKIVSNPLNNFFEQVANLRLVLGKSIDFKNKISELIVDANKSEWVRNGLLVNKDSENCSFCGNIISDERIKALQSHYDEQYESMLSELSKYESLLSEELKKDYSYIFYDLSNVYFEFKDRLEDSKSEINNIIAQTKLQLKNLLLIIDKKRRNASSSILLNEDISKLEIKINLEVIKLNEIIKLSNEKGLNVVNYSIQARKKLREHRVILFLENPEYNEINTRLNTLSKSMSDSIDKLKSAKEESKVLIEQVQEIESRMQDQSAGAVLVNQYLKSYFGHSRLELRAISNLEKATHFIIYREEEEANNLSEGECSLISFCYFMASIKDKIENSYTSNLVVFVDDPISSLDSSHVFFVYGLIDSLISPRLSSLQLFISTHNLEFLKFLKRLGVSTIYKKTNYIIKRYQKGLIQSSRIECMPSYLSDYATEFNFLFKEIYDISRDNYSGDKFQFFSNSFTSLYSFSNNARKFLECYLFYKFPGSNDPFKELNQLLLPQDVSFVNRIVNEYSHLTTLDRGMLPIDFEELEKCSKIIMDLVKTQDEKQYNSLVSSCR